MTSRKEFLYALGAVLVFTIVALAVERLVVTDAEAIRQTLSEIARDVQSNDLQRVLRHVSKANPSLVQRAEAEMPNYKFTECRVTKIHETDVDASSEPRSAKVRFNVVASGTFRQGSVEYSDTVPRWIELHLVKEADGRWRVQDYDHRPPQQFMFGQPLDEIER
jgi:ketosteroid isomerase-like protein